VDPQEPTVFFVENDHFFDRNGIYADEHGDYGDNPLRYALFSRAALAWLPTSAPGRNTLVHIHDWHASLAPVFARVFLDHDDYYRHLPFVLTAHNAGYQGQYGREVIRELGLPDWLDSDEWMTMDGRLNLLKSGLRFSDVVTTVSPNHEAELRTPEGGFGLHGIFNDLGNRFQGILNGIDTEVWNPATDPEVHLHYSEESLERKTANKLHLQEELGLPRDPDIPLFAMTARLAGQKGFDILLESGTIGRVEAQWYFLGEGEARYRDALQALAHAHPDRVAVGFHFTEDREHRLLAGADFLLMPSQYEPCGLTQMRAQRYGAVPIVRRVGGLADTVEHGVTGLVFDGYDAGQLAAAIHSAVELYQDRESWMMWAREGMSRDFSWEPSVIQYQAVYARAHAHREQVTGG
jgi:starch synthase